jgi:hypothetical protein
VLPLLHWTETSRWGNAYQARRKIERKTEGACSTFDPLGVLRRAERDGQEKQGDRQGHRPRLRHPRYSSSPALPPSHHAPAAGSGGTGDSWREWWRRQRGEGVKRKGKGTCLLIMRRLLGAVALALNDELSAAVGARSASTHSSRCNPSAPFLPVLIF